MENVVTRHWWAWVVRGVVALMVSSFAFAEPDLTLASLVLFFGAYALVDGILALGSVVSRQSHSDPAAAPTRALLLEGAAGIAACLFAVFWPSITTFALLYLIASWALVTGVLELVSAFVLRRDLKGGRLLALGGAASILFASALVAWPVAGTLVVVWMLGIYAFVFGVLMISLGLMLRTPVPSPGGRPSRMRLSNV